MRRIPLILLPLIAISCSAIRNTPQPATVGWEFDIAPGSTRDSTVTVVNRCRQGHGFALSTDAGRFIEFPGATSLDLAPGASRTLPVRFSAAGLEPATFTGHVIVECMGCSSEPSCLQDRDLIAARMTVVGGSGPRMAALPSVATHCVTRDQDCVSPGYRCLVMYPEHASGVDLPPFADAPIHLAGEARLVPQDRPSMRFHLTEEPPSNLQYLPVERVSYVSGETAARLGFESVAILPGNYEIDRALGEHGGVSFEVDVAGARDAEILEAYYLERWSDLPVANPDNPFDHVGVYHNAGVDFALDGGGENEGPECDPQHRISRVRSRVERFSELTAELRAGEGWDRTWLTVAATVDAAGTTADLSAPEGGFTERGLNVARARLTPRQYEAFSPVWEHLGDLLDRAERGTIDYDGYQAAVVEIESDLAAQAPNRETAAPAWSMLATARYSAFMAHESWSAGGASRLRINWWKAAKADLQGAALGVSLGGGVGLGGPGAVVGGVIYSAVEIGDQRAKQRENQAQDFGLEATGGAPRRASLCPPPRRGAVFAR